jgi:uncharacterized protein (DUF58 family)
MINESQIEEIMARVRRLEIKARRLVRESFSGEYLSSFRGQGLDFDDYREYQHGDEVRFIDWNVTARMNQPYVRKFREEREANIILAVDISGSVDYGSIEYSKREVAAEAAAVLGFSALQNGDKVGLLLFAAEPVLFVPPEKGTRHLLRMIREILAAMPDNPATSIRNACDFLIRTLRRKSVVFMISDFQSDPLDKPLGKIAHKHDTIALRVADPLERELPKVGRVTMIDPETGFETRVNTRNSNLRMAYGKMAARHREGVERLFRKHGIDHCRIRTNGDILASLHRLLKRRARRRVR